MTEQELIRREKLKKLAAQGINPYPEKFEISHRLSEASVLEDGLENIAVAGRILSIRKMGKLIFINISSIDGKLQLLMKNETLGEEQIEFFDHSFDIGDFIGAKGTMFTTQKGEKTLRVLEFQFLAKCFRPLPEKFHGITDVESRYRKRYLDLIMNKETQERFLGRTAIVRNIRTFLENKGFLEVDTPILHANPSGALAKPFITHHNTLDMDLYLRIAPETYLKRLIVGGFTNIFEFAKCFRNEGISPNHLQEFTMLEGYSAYWNYEDNIQFMRELITEVIQKTFNTLKLTISGQEVDFSQEWKRVSFRELILADTGLDLNEYETAEALLQAIRDKGIALDNEEVENLGRGNLIDVLYKKVSRPYLIQPTILTSHPIDLSPLARANDDNPSLTDRFQIVVNGVEIVNAYSELVDPIEQRKRLEEQALLNQKGDSEAMVMDEDYLYTMEYGMPPISGWGIGIDRLVQFLYSCDNIKDGVLFPFNRSKAID